MIRDAVKDFTGTLTFTERKALALGLKFAPQLLRSQDTMEELEVAYDNLKGYLTSKFNLGVYGGIGNKPPPIIITRAIRRLKRRYNQRTLAPQPPKIPSALMEALVALKNNKKIIIKKADKNNAIVVLSKEAYLKMGYKQLKNPSEYQEIEEPDTKFEEIHQEGLALLRRWRQAGAVYAREFHRLSGRKVKMPSIYFLPKIHKAVDEETGTVPGRPIVSGCAGPTRAIDTLVTRTLQPFLKRLPFRLQDRRQFLNYLNQQDIPPEAALVSFDVVSLYPSIPQEEAVQKVLLFLLQQRDRLGPPYHLLRDSLLHVLKGNLFEFNNQHFLQVRGTAMGCKMSVALADIYMHMTFEERLVPELNIPWRRYIDDVFCFLRPTDPAPEDILKKLNLQRPSVRFTLEEGKEDLKFLDVIVYRRDGRLSTKTHEKVDNAAYLHRLSYHPPHIHRNLPYSIALRYRTITDDDEVLHQQLEKLRGFLLNRGYKKKDLRDQFKKACEKDRALLLKEPEAKPAAEERPCYLVLTYTPALLGISFNLRKLGRELEDKVPEIQGINIRVAWRVPPNLRKILVRAK